MTMEGQAGVMWLQARERRPDRRLGGAGEDPPDNVGETVA